MLSVAFSPDGKTVATLSDDKTVRRWETATGELRAALTHQGPVYSVAFSPDGKYLLLPSGNQAQFYLLRPADLIQAGCDYLPANLTRAQWDQYLPDEPYRQTCPNRPRPPELSLFRSWEPANQQARLLREYFARDGSESHGTADSTNQ